MCGRVATAAAARRRRRRGVCMCGRVATAAAAARRRRRFLFWHLWGPSVCLLNQACQVHRLPCNRRKPRLV